MFVSYKNTYLTLYGLLLLLLLLLYGVNLLSQHLYPDMVKASVPTLEKSGIFIVYNENPAFVKNGYTGFCHIISEQICKDSTKFDRHRMHAIGE